MKENGHWYTKTGEPMHFVEKAKGGGTRPTTLADARKLALLPSVTQVLRILDKPALTKWKIDQAVQTVLTAPWKPGEKLDDFVQRVLYTEAQQDQEAAAAADLGTRIHAAIELALSGQPYEPSLREYIEPVLEDIFSRGKVLSTETVLVGQGYAGKCDLIQAGVEYDLLSDFKTTKKLPTKGSWPEHVLQLSAYAAAHHAEQYVDTIRSTLTGNLYISTTEPGKFAWFENPPWLDTFERGFRPLLLHWIWSTGYDPR